MTVTAPVLCAHCFAPVHGRSRGDRVPLCRRALSVAPCVDCEGHVGPELGWPGLVWLAARCGVSVERMTEAVTW
jgi:hypothetical protein